MLDWIKRKLKGGGRTLVGLADDVFDVTSGIWKTITRMGDLWRAGWKFLSPRLTHMWSAIAGFASRFHAAMRALVTILIPRMIRTAVGALDRALRRVISAAVNVLKGAINAVKNWAGKTFDLVRGMIRNLTRWTTGQISTIWNWITRAGYWLWDVVSHPEKLAAWVVPYLLGPITRFMISKAEPIGRWLLARSVRAALAAAGLIERVIVRLM